MKSPSFATAIVSICIVALLSGVAVAQNSSVYVSFLTGLKSGGTNIYQITQGGAQLMGTLDIGGGGPVAIDAQQNVYVIPADWDSGLYQLTTNVYRYAPGSTQGTQLFKVDNLGAQAMTVGADGTVYVAGAIPESDTYVVAKFSPPAYTQQTLSISQNPRYPTGISVDASGNLFVGWLGSFRNIPIDKCATGCITELPAGQSKWVTRLQDLAANAMTAGPFVTSDGSLIFWTGAAGRFNYIETVPSGETYPSSLAQLSPTLFDGGNVTLAYNASGKQLWATGFGFNGLLGTNVYGINYPSGHTAISFPVDSPSNLIFITGIGVRPANFP
ncbi:MAG TPA: hypothetical protein VH437_00090 [Terriglobales bacterium]|jgi:hypothetical protein